MDQTRSHLIKGVRLLDLPTHGVPLRDILVIDGAIVEIAPPGALSVESVPAFDAERRMVMPGLVNSHSHSHGAMAKGLGNKWTLEHLLNASRWMTSGLNSEDKYLSPLLNAAELHGEFPVPTPEGFEAVARAYSGRS